MKNYTNSIKNFPANFKKELHGDIKEKSIWIIVGQIMTIISAVFWCLTIIGLIWGLPMILGCLQRLHNNRKITVWHLVIAIIFYWLIGGICTLIGVLINKRL